MAVTAAETLRFFDEMRADVGVWGELMTTLSRFFGTEEVFADIDIAKSHEGAGFLAVYCPQEEEAERVRDLLEPFGPPTSLPLFRKLLVSLTLRITAAMAAANLLGVSALAKECVLDIRFEDYCFSFGMCFRTKEAGTYRQYARTAGGSRPPVPVRRHQH